MIYGTVKFWDRARAFGFASIDGSEQDIFIHVTALSGGMSELTEGERVSFEIGAGHGKSAATGVRRLDSNATAAGAVFGATAALIDGTATGDANAPGATLTATAPRYGD